MSLQKVVPSGTRRPRRAASAAQVRRRHFAILLLLLAGLVALAAGLMMVARYVAPWGNLSWLLGNPKFLDRPRNVLVVGLDREGRGARGDLYMLARLDTRVPAVTILSVPVETQTTIPGYGVGKLADVPAVGGGPLARQTIEALLGVGVDRLVILDPGLQGRVIDRLGGIDVLVTRAMAFKAPGAAATVQVPAGKQRLDGKRAIAFAAARSGDAGDLKRISRQQYLAAAILRQAGRNPWKLASATKALVKEAGGDLAQPEAEEVVRFLESHPTTRFTTIPGDPGYGGAWIPSPTRIQALLERVESLKQKPGAKTPMAEIRFSPKREKAANGLANQLVDRGVTVVRTAPLEEEDATNVVAREPSGRVDHIVRTLLPAAPWVLSDDPSPYSADYTIVVGLDAPEIR
ncbi:MAG: LCP family protein [Candidatus Sericytochromatia bacterium]|nr:LCP family protein [Candidatus Tanganyikabacteria bacterium]